MHGPGVQASGGDVSDEKTWEAKAKRLARAVLALRPNDEYCDGCGHYQCVSGRGETCPSTELAEALADIGVGGGHGMDNHPRGDGSG